MDKVIKNIGMTNITLGKEGGSKVVYQGPKPETLRAMFTNEEDEDIPFPEDEPPSPEARLRGIVTGYWRDHEGLNALFLISQHGEFVRIRTPFLYPDGGVIDIFAKENLRDIENPWTLTDLGETIGQYTWTSFVPKICEMHGINLHNGQLMIRCNQDNLARCVMSLGQTMALVAVQSMMLNYRW